MRNTIIWFIWESQNKWSNSLLGSLGKSEPCWWSLPYAGVAGRPMFSLHQYRWSSRFTFFPVSHAQTPFILPFPGGGCAGCGGAMCYKWPQPSSTLLPGVMRQNALGCCQPLQPCNQVRFRPTSLVPCSAERRQVELLLCSQHIWTARVGRKWNFEAMKMVVPVFQVSESPYQRAQVLTWIRFLTNKALICDWHLQTMMNE